MKPNCQVAKSLLELRFVEPDFAKCIFTPEKTWREAIRHYTENKCVVQTAILINEAVVNECIFLVYSLSSEDKELVIEKQSADVADIPVTLVAKDHYLNMYGHILRRKALEKIENVTIRESVDNVQDVISAIIRNNSLEDICVRYEVNPIDVWEILIHSNEISKYQAKEMSMEFLGEVLRDILMEDEDGIIPLVPSAGEKMLIERIEDKFREKGFTMAQYSQFDTVLGWPIIEYLNKHFFAEFSDHLNLFSYLPKSPFIWHLSSGPEQGVDCYLIIYKWSRDKLMGIRSVYIENRERALVNRHSDLAGNESSVAQNEKDKINKQLKEIESFKQKIDELLTEGYDPILDDGVGKNIAPLQEKGMIPYEVLNVGQLKKYLNADW